MFRSSILRLWKPHGLPTDNLLPAGSAVIPSTEPVVGDSNPLVSAFTFSLAVVGEIPIPGLKAAATALLDIIRRVGSINETRRALQELAAHMEYVLFLSLKVKGEVGADTVKRLQTAITELQQNIPRDKNNIIAFFNADDTRARLQTLANHLDMAIQAFQIALQLNTDKKIEEAIQEMKKLKCEKQVSQGPGIKQDLKNLELKTERSLKFTVIAISRVQRNISNAKIFVDQDFTSTIVGACGVDESIQDLFINAQGDVSFSTYAGDPSTVTAWSDLLKRQ